MQRTDIEFTFDETVRTMGVTPERLQKLIDEGQIEVVREGIRTMIPRRSILEYLAEHNGLANRAKKGAERK
jgi:hypothetical protein